MLCLVREPSDKVLEGRSVSPVVVLGEVPQVGPREVRVESGWTPRKARDQLVRGAHHSVFIRVNEEHERSSYSLFVHQCPVQAALVTAVA